MRPNLPQNGVIKESQFIPEETEADVALEATQKKGFSNGNTTLATSGTHHEDSNLTNSSITDSAGLMNSTNQQQQPAANASVNRNLEYRPSKPTEWRVQLANASIKVNAEKCILYAKGSW